MRIFMDINKPKKSSIVTKINEFLMYPLSSKSLVNFPAGASQDVKQLFPLKHYEFELVTSSLVYV